MAMTSGEHAFPLQALQRCLAGRVQLVRCPLATRARTGAGIETVKRGWSTGHTLLQATLGIEA